MFLKCHSLIMLVLQIIDARTRIILTVTFDFNSVLNLSNFVMPFKSNGSLLQSFGAIEEKALSPYVTRFVLGSNNSNSYPNPLRQDNHASYIACNDDAQQEVRWFCVESELRGDPCKQ